MSFLNSAMLFGLAAAAIPILIHLFHRQRVSTVEFSSIAFIKHLNLHQSQAMKLRQWLILLMRTLIIILAVLAFARPTIEGSFWSFLGSGVHQKTAVALVMDSSYSMGNGDQAPFNLAKAAGLRMLNVLEDGDEVVMVLTAKPPRAIQDRPILGIDRMRTALQDTEVSNGSGDIGTALNLASSVLNNTTILNREIYLITDLQRNDWQSLRQTAPFLNIDPDMHVYIVPVDSPPIENVSIDGVSMSGQLVATNQPNSVVATFTNRSGDPVRGRNIGVFVDGIKRGSQAISLEPGESGNVRFGVSLNTPGEYSGYVELDHDDQLKDNRRYFTLTVPEAINVTVLSTGEAGYFLQQVLSPVGPMQTPVNVRTASENVLNGDQLTDTDVIVLDGDLSLSGPQLTSLDRYVTAGGGLVIFLGSGVNTTTYNTSLLPAVFDCTIQNRVGAPGQRQSYLSLGDMDYGHPVFNVFQEQSGTIPDSPRFYSSYHLNVNPQTRVIARFSDGVPAVVEGRNGRGKALLIASTPNTQWSDLPLKSLFVPLMHRSVRYVHADFNGSGAATLVGSPVERIVDWAEQDEPVTVEHPSGNSEGLRPVSTISGMSVVVSRTEETGVYVLRSGVRSLGAFAVNVNTNESDQTQLTQSEVGTYLDGVDHSILSPDTSPEQALFESSQGFEIWKALLWAALLMIVLENWLTRLPSRPRGKRQAI
ncbi:MAG: BatA and WFA domain-containing protein [Gemmatimonadota bacterium]|nr:BatA and WFA domain-containing protein [Gemmatimonadota bacterium]